MRPRKGRFGAVPYVGNKLFPSFAKKIKKQKNWKKNSIFRKKYYFWNFKK